MTHKQRILLQSVSRSNGWSIDNPPWVMDSDLMKTVRRLDRLVEMGYLEIIDNKYVTSAKGKRALAFPARK